ncbi:phasin family protein [Sphingomonas sp. ID0503]|uniref:phasin family protein n=1 Tax=Sphingomonas sp. ID0503 TaxID=3399691 RepID=UPI003AFA3106
MAKPVLVKAAPRASKKVAAPIVDDEALPPVIQAGDAILPTIQPVAIMEAPVSDEQTVADATPSAGADDMASAAENISYAPELGTEKVKALFEDATTKAKGAFEKSTKAFEDATELTRGNVEAFVASGRAAAKGTEAILQDVASYGRTSFETASAAFKSFAAAKSPSELLQLQSEYAKTSFDSAVAEASKVSEAYIKLVSDVFEPISGRIQLASDKVRTAVY